MNLTALPNSVLILFPWCKTRLVEQAGGEVARECRDELWHCVHRQVVGMSVSEVRGYVRAYAVGIADAQVEEVLGRRSLKLSLRDRVLASGVEQLVSMTVRDALLADSPEEARSLAA
jgi:hypothetical protein